VHSTRSLCALSAVVVVCFSAPAMALPDYRVTGGINQNSSSLGSYDVDGFETTGAEKHFDDTAFDPSFEVQASSLAGPGTLHAHAFSRISKTGTFGSTSIFTQNGTGLAQATYTDMMITGPAGSGPISVSYNVHLDGTYITEASLTPTQQASAASSVQLQLFAKGTSLGVGTQTDQTIAGTHQPLSSTGFLVGFTGNNDITSPTFSAPVNTPFSIALQLEAFAGVSVRFNESFLVAANSDFGDTLTFSTDEPVFNLPAGYTATSADAGIQGNTFTVPEPASLSLLTIASLMLARRRR